MKLRDFALRAMRAQEAIDALGAGDPLKVEHEIQRQMLERLGIEWTPGEPFVALVEDEIRQEREAHEELRQAHDAHMNGDPCPVCGDGE